VRRVNWQQEDIIERMYFEGVAPPFVREAHDTRIDERSPLLVDGKIPRTWALVGRESPLQLVFDESGTVASVVKCQ
jgi:hypothetical protein